MLNTTFKLKYNISFHLEKINTHKVPFFKPCTLEETITSQQDDKDNQEVCNPSAVLHNCNDSEFLGKMY